MCPPNLEEVEGGISLWGCACIHPSVTLFDACHILWTMHARVLKFHRWIPHGKIADPCFYTPGIYAEGYIVFVFSFVCSSVLNYVPFVELLQCFTLKQLEWSISHQPLIRKHSYLVHRYPGGSAFIPWLLTPVSMPRAGARGQNLGHL